MTQNEVKQKIDLLKAQIRELEQGLIPEDGVFYCQSGDNTMITADRSGDGTSVKISMEDTAGEIALFLSRRRANLFADYIKAL